MFRQRPLARPLQRSPSWLCCLRTGNYLPLSFSCFAVSEQVTTCLSFPVRLHSDSWTGLVTPFHCVLGLQALLVLLCLIVSQTPTFVPSLSQLVCSSYCYSPSGAVKCNLFRRNPSCNCHSLFAVSQDCSMSMFSSFTPVHTCTRAHLTDSLCVCVCVCVCGVVCSSPSSPCKYLLQPFCHVLCCCAFHLCPIPPL